MTATELYNLVKKMKRQTLSPNKFEVVSIPDVKHKLSITVEGYPKFFIYTQDDTFNKPNIIGELLSVEYTVPCTVVENGKHVSSNFTVVTLRSTDEQLQADFIYLVYMMLLKVDDTPSKKQLSQEVENLIAIFSALKKTPIKKIQGLWAELLIIEQSKDSELTAKAWHSDPSSKYDFSNGSDKIEVKSTSSEQRLHRFSLDQLNPSTNSNLLIASVIVRETAQSDTGLSIKDLYDKICCKIASVDARIHIYDTILNTLGSDYPQMNSVFFDYTESADTLRYFDSQLVPRIDKAYIPEFVSEVKFASELSSINDIFNSNYNFTGKEFFCKTLI